MSILLKEYWTKQISVTNLDIYGSMLVAFIGGVAVTLIAIYL